MNQAKQHPRKDIYNRIVFAKTLLNKAKAISNDQYDMMSFGQVVLLLHDAAEILIAAVADQLHAHIKGNSSLVDLCNKVSEKGSTLKYLTQIKNLNTHRNSLKHQGIFPDPTHNAQLPLIIESFLAETCEDLLGIIFEEVSLRHLIDDKDVANYVRIAEERLESEQYERALIEIAKAMYLIVDSSGELISFLSMHRNSETSEPNDEFFPEHGSTNHAVFLLQNGVNIRRYHAFKNLTPELGRKLSTKEFLVKWSRFHGHSGNWTKENSRFCIDFCVDVALKCQRRPEDGPVAIDFHELYEDIITAKENGATIWDGFLLHDNESPDNIDTSKNVILKLKAGESIVGVATDMKSLGKILIHSFYSNNSDDIFSGSCCVMRSQVEMSSRLKS